MIEAKILLLIVYFCARVNGLGILGQYAMNLENVIFHEKKLKMRLLMIFIVTAKYRLPVKMFRKMHD